MMGVKGKAMMTQDSEQALGQPPSALNTTDENRVESEFEDLKYRISKNTKKMVNQLMDAASKGDKVRYDSLMNQVEEQAKINYAEPLSFKISSTPAPEREVLNQTAYGSSQNEVTLIDHCGPSSLSNINQKDLPPIQQASEGLNSSQGETGLLHSTRKSQPSSGNAYQAASREYSI